MTNLIFILLHNYLWVLGCGLLMSFAKNTPLTRTTMSLLQDVLRSHTTASTSIEKRLDNVSISPRNPQSHAVDSDDSDDEYVNVVCFFLKLFIVVSSTNRRLCV